MPLNVKSEKAHDLARRLAKETGETLTEAVTVALSERLERVCRRRRARATTEELRAIGRRCAAQLKRPVADHGTLLYDKRGLPR